MKKNIWYKFYWENGMITICKGYSKHEMKVCESKYGKLVKKVFETCI
jgi:hypothetical protein